MRPISLVSKSVLVTKFAHANLVSETFAVNLLNSQVAIYLSSLWSVSFFSSSVIFVSKFAFLSKLLTLGILFPTAVNAAFVAKLLTSGLLLSNSVSFVFFKQN